MVQGPQDKGLMRVPWTARSSRAMTVFVPRPANRDVNQAYIRRRITMRLLLVPRLLLRMPQTFEVLVKVCCRSVGWCSRCLRACPKTRKPSAACAT